MKRKKRFSDGGELVNEAVVSAARPRAGFDISTIGMGRPADRYGPSLGADSVGGGGMPATPVRSAPVAPQPRMPIARTAGYLGPTIGGADGRVSFGMGRRGAIGAGASLPFKKGGEVKAKTKKMAKGGSTASKRADGCAQRGKTKGRMV